MKIFIFLMILLSFFSQSPANSQINKETAEIVMNYSKKMDDHVRNMNQMAKNNQSLNDIKIANEISDICLLLGTSIDNMRDLLFIYHFLSNANEKNMVGKITEIRRKTIIKLTEILHGQLNRGISMLRNQGMIDSAIEIRKDMGEIQFFFDKLKIESESP